MNHRFDETTVSEEREADDTADGDRLAEALDDPHCRYLLKYLRDRPGPASVSEVATYAAAQITDSSPDEISADVERRVQTWFYHGQLPMLDDYGVVEFDPDSGTVRLVDDDPL